MSGNDDGGEHLPSGRRKDGRPYAEGNERDDGSYAVGRNRPPAEHRFAKGDGRKRGRRPKGVRNADTEFQKELARKMPVLENGKKRNMSKSRAVDVRLIDNAVRKGDNRAIEMVDIRRRRIAEAERENRRYHTLSDREILKTWIRDREEELQIDPDLFGDPEPDAVEEADAIEDGEGDREEDADGGERDD
jgi:Family of unknown function (DUF5681)